MKGIFGLALVYAVTALPQAPPAQQPAVPTPTTPAPKVSGLAKGARPQLNIGQWLGKMGIDPAKATPVPGG